MVPKKTGVLLGEAIVVREILRVESDVEWIQ